MLSKTIVLYRLQMLIFQGFVDFPLILLDLLKMAQFGFKSPSRYLILLAPLGLALGFALGFTEKEEETHTRLLFFFCEKMSLIRSAWRFSSSLIVFLYMAFMTSLPGLHPPIFSIYASGMPFRWQYDAKKCRRS